MTEREVRQEISAAEKALSRIEKQHGKLERLVASTSDRLAKTGDDADAQTLLRARMERDTARQMLEENQAEQLTTKERIEALTSQAEQAALIEEYEAAVTDLQAARGKWRRSAEQVVRTLKKVMEEEGERRGNIYECFRRAEAAALAAGVEIPAEVKYKHISWSEVPGTSVHGAIETEDMTMQPPLFKNEQIVSMSAMMVRPEGAPPVPSRFATTNYSDVIPPDRVALSLRTMGLVPEEGKRKPVEVPRFEELSK